MTEDIKVFAPEKVTVTIRGQEYIVRELSFVEKVEVLGPLSEMLSNALKVIKFGKDENDRFKMNVPEGFTLGDINIGGMILSGLNAIPKLLAKSIPEFEDWDNLPESESREAISKALAKNDLGGFIVNFIMAAVRVIR